METETICMLDYTQSRTINTILQGTVFELSLILIHSVSESVYMTCYTAIAFVYGFFVLSYLFDIMS